MERCQVWHDISTLRLYARSDDVRRCMMSLPFDSTHDRQRRSWHDITVLGQCTWSDDVGCDMPSSPLDSTHGRKTSGATCHHHLWAARTVERRLAWHAIIAFQKHKRSNDVARGMPLSLLGSTNGQTTSNEARHHLPWLTRTVR